MTANLCRKALSYGRKATSWRSNRRSLCSIQIGSAWELSLPFRLYNLSDLTQVNPPLERSVSAAISTLRDSNCLQSSLVLRFVKDQFDDYRESTIGAAFLTQTITLDENTTVKFEIWDTAGQERYKSLAPMYYRNANCAVVVYDVTQAVSTIPGARRQKLNDIVLSRQSEVMGEGASTSSQ